MPVVLADGGPWLGTGWFNPSSDGGGIGAEDGYCDGDNGIITALYVWRNGGWARSGLVSVRGCGSVNYNYLYDNNPRPAYGERVRIRVCKLLPDGTWKDCKDGFTVNQ